MNLVTATELRTKTSQIVEALLSGESLELVHRSKIIGEIKPKKSGVKVYDAKRAERLARKLNLKPLSYQEREERYRVYMRKRHGQSIS